MKLITEQIDDAKIVITEGKNGKRNTFIEGVFLQGELTNRNGRRYPISTLAREVGKYNENFVKTGRALGELGPLMVLPSTLTVLLTLSLP